MSHPKKMRTQLSSVNDVVSEILTRLPVKSIIRFRCVSKSWNSIITDPIFITTHFNQAKSLSKNSHNGYLLYTKETEDSSSHKELCIDVCNRDRTLTHISRFQISFSHVRMVGFCNGMFCLRNYDNNVLYLWNPSIREFKMLDPTRFCFPFTSGSVTIGFAYHSQTNDFKILRIVTYKRIEYLVQVPPAEAEVYTLSTDSWRKAVISPEIEPFFRSFVEPTHLFFNGALHSLAYCRERSFSSHKCFLSHSHKCILSFDVNDERFHKIMLPQNYSSMGKIERLAVFKGSLALIVCCDDGPDGDETDDNMDICHIWVMREYGVVESWTKISVPIDCAEKFFCCTDSGELLIEAYEDRNLVSFDPESLNSNNLGIESPHWLVYTADLMQSLVLLDQHNKAEKEPNNPLSPERNPREATNTSSDARPLRVKYPSLPSWEVQVTNDSGEGETLIVPRSKHVPYVPWTGGLVEVDFVEECYSLIGSIKNWIWSSSQSSFARQNKLSHEIDLLRNRVESQASIIRTLERCLLSFGPCETEGSSDPRIWSSSQSSFACQNNISHEIDLLNMVESQASTMMSQSRRKPKQLLSGCLLDDVVYDILSRLPVKSLTRFRCVSKSWNSIITNAIFIKTHFDRAKSLSNNNGYLLYVPAREDYLHFLCTVVCNSDHTLTLISSFKIPFSDVRMVGFCNGMFCLHNYHTNVLYLWNPSIRKFKMLSTTRFCFPSSTGCVTHGLVYHSQSNDFKILRIVCYERIGGKQRTSAEAEVYTLSTDSWRRVVISVNSLSVSRPIGSVDYMYRSPCLFFNGALLSIASFRGHKFILSFDVNDERFYEIMLPQKYLDKVGLECERLVVFNGSLALLVLCDDIAANKDICHMWVMREYGAVESWTKENVLVDSVEGFFGCTDSGELLIHTLHRGLISYDPESLNENNLGIQYPHWLSYTADFMESLVLLDQHDEAEMEHDTTPFPERNSREATNTSSDARFLRVKYPSLPSGEVLVTNDSGEGESLIVPRSKHVPYVPWTGGLVEVDFVEECCSLIESMKNWIWSSSQSSFARQNKLSHEIDLLQNRVESQASTIRTLERCLWSFGPREAGGSSDPIPDAAGVTPLADEGNPMNTTVQSKDGSSRCVTRLAP